MSKCVQKICSDICRGGGLGGHGPRWPFACALPKNFGAIPEVFVCEIDSNRAVNHSNKAVREAVWLTMKLELCT